MSLAHFERTVQPHLPYVRSGQLILFSPQGLELWADRHTIHRRPPPSPAKPNKRPADRPSGWPSVVVRHKVACWSNAGKRCTCEPGYLARVWDPRRRRPIHSPTFRLPSEAIAWKEEMQASLKRGGTIGQRPPSITVSEAVQRFLHAIQDGTARNKKGRRYKRTTAKTMEYALTGRIEHELGRLRLDDVRRADVQTMVDEMVAEQLSGSRVRNILNALRSLYRYCMARELAQSSPATTVLLSALDETPRNRVATPREFRELLSALKPPDRTPFALAGYATARSQEIFGLRWGKVEWEAKLLGLADQDEYAKTPAAKRSFPLVPPLERLLRDEWERQGHPDGRQLVCPARRIRRGVAETKLSTNALYARADRHWEARGLRPIRLHESRHTASSWLRAAGIDLKTRSVLMGHATTASTDRGGGSITDDRYTHLLPGELEQAGRVFARYLAKNHS